MARTAESLRTTSPALRFQSRHYPPNYHGRVPTRVRMAVTARPDALLRAFDVASRDIVAEEGGEYPVWVNSHGAVTAILPDGMLLGLRTAEFDVVAWDDAPDAKREPYEGDRTIGLLGCVD